MFSTIDFKSFNAVELCHQLPLCYSTQINGCRSYLSEESLLESIESRRAQLEAGRDPMYLVVLGKAGLANHKTSTFFCALKIRYSRQKWHVLYFGGPIPYTPLAKNGFIHP